MWIRTTKTWVYSQINQRISSQARTLKPDLIRFAGRQENVLFWVKKQSFPRLLCHWQTVVWTQTQKSPPTPHLPLCPPNSLSCKDSVSLGRTAISEKVNSGWPSRLGQAGTPAQARRVLLQRGGRGDGWSQGPCPLSSGLHSWPRWGCSEIRDGFPFFFLLSKNEDSNLMLPLLSPWRRL